MSQKIFNVITACSGTVNYADDFYVLVGDYEGNIKRRIKHEIQKRDRRRAKKCQFRFDKSKTEVIVFIKDEELRNSVEGMIKNKFHYAYGDVEDTRDAHQ